MSVDVGDGWRPVEVGERIEVGDEYLDESDGWRRVPISGMAFTSYLLPHRRRVAAAAADAPTPTPHPWCRDVARDEAIRAAEDAAKVTLPEHRDLPATVALLLAEAGVARERVEELRERVAELESSAKLAPAANADAEAKLAEAMDRVRRLESEREDALLHLPACCGSLRDAAATLEAERDAAIRERDSLQAMCDTRFQKLLELAAKLNASRDERDEARWERDSNLKASCDSARDSFLEIERLKARVKQLEAAPRGWLTEEERAALDWWCNSREAVSVEQIARWRDTLRSLLSRSTTPASEAGTVRKPQLLWANPDLTPAHVAEIERHVSGEVGK